MLIAKKVKPAKNKIIFYLSIVNLVYFISILLVDEYKLDATLIGVFRELLTLPFLALLIFIIVMSVVSWIKEKFIINSYPFFSLVISALTTALLILKS